MVLETYGEKKLLLTISTRRVFLFLLPVFLRETRSSPLDFRSNVFAGEGREEEEEEIFAADSSKHFRVGGGRRGLSFACTT